MLHSLATHTPHAAAVNDAFLAATGPRSKILVVVVQLQSLHWPLTRFRTCLTVSMLAGCHAQHVIYLSSMHTASPNLWVTSMSRDRRSATYYPCLLHNACHYTRACTLLTRSCTMQSTTIHNRNQALRARLNKCLTSSQTHPTPVGHNDSC